MDLDYQRIPESELKNTEVEGVYFKFNESEVNWDQFRGHTGQKLIYFKRIYPNMVFARKIDKPRFPNAPAYPFGY
jgi:hypothetical protein